MGNDAALIVSGINIDNCEPKSLTVYVYVYSTRTLAAGNSANSLSGGKPAAHNTDGFDGMSSKQIDRITFRTHTKVQSQRAM
jgi:hypothetical protein